MDATLLVADRDPQWRDAFQQFFSECGFQVETASDDRDCLAKLRALEPEVVIAEWEMFRGGPEGVAAQMGEGPGWSKRPAVLILGDAPPEMLARRSGLPASSCFQKPVPMMRLVDSICLAIALGEIRRAECVA